MFANLSRKIKSCLSKIKKEVKITDKNIEDSVREIRLALLEADVTLEVVKELIKKIKEKAVGQDIKNNFSPGQMFVKIVKEEIKSILGEKNEVLNLKSQPPAVILMVGLQGSGKTTSTAKLALMLKTEHNKKVIMVSTDIYRPAAMEQLAILGKNIEVDCHSSKHNQVNKIIEEALKIAREGMYDVLIIDTAGRLHVDKRMMEEIQQIKNYANPVETLFVIDSMMGQSAVNIAKTFNDATKITGLIATKTDGDARGGAILSVRYVVGKPVKFVGVGEKIYDLETFHPERVTSRIMGMGDIISIINDIEKKVDKKNTKRLLQKIKRKKTFTLEDFKEQLKNMKKIGGIEKIVKKLPIGNKSINNIDNQTLIRMEAIINSMTLKERKEINTIKLSRKKRISKGSGTTMQDVNKTLRQFKNIQSLMKKVDNKSKLANLINNFR